MLDIPSEIREFETKARKNGWSINELCAHVKVNRATWQRWKHGTFFPRMETWGKVTTAIKHLKSKD